jgi:hypothetical protein
LAVAGLLAQPTEPSGARSMFNNPLTGTVRATTEPAGPTGPATLPPKPAPVRVVGIHFWLDLDGIGPVLDRRVFQTGERIRLNVRSNCDGYLAIWTLGADGRTALLVPSDGRVGVPLKQGAPFVSAPMRFSDPAGDERLMLFFASRRASLPSTETMTSDDARAALFGVGARDLAVEVEAQTPGEIGTYVVNRAGGPVFRDLLLKHVSMK